jgi:hypothetical protein
MDEAGKRKRLAENEVIFREANSNIAEFIITEEGANTEKKIPFYCECSDRSCKERIKLTPKDYKKCHKSKRQFVVIPGHEVPQIEKVIKEKDKFNVIEKFGDPPPPEDIDAALKKIEID